MNIITLNNRLTTHQKNAIISIQLQLKEYMSKILPVYRQSTSEQQAELRTHNFILNALLDVMGE